MTLSTVSAPARRTSAMSSSMWRTLFPPKARPDRSSRLTSTVRPSSRLSPGAGCNGVG